MSLRTKILSGYGLVLGLLLIVGVYALVSLQRLGRSSGAILRENYRSIRAAENMVAAVERQDSSVLTVLLTGERAELETFRENEIAFIQALGRAQDNVTLAAEPEALAAIESSYLAYLESVDPVRQNDLALEDEAVTIAYYSSTILPAFQQVREAAVQLRDLNQDEMVVASDETQVVARTAMWSTAVVGGIAAVFGLIFSLILTGWITNPLHEIAQATERLAAGQYDVEVDQRSADEMGQLAGKINEMARKLKGFHDLNVGQIIAEKQRNEAILDSIVDGLIVVDADFKIVAINPKAAEMFETHVGKATGRHLFEVTHEEMLFETIRESAERGVTLGLNDETTSFSIRQGEQVAYFNYATTPVKTNDGRALGVVVVFQDMTKLKELDRLKTEFVMTASHELRTPLTGMGMSIGLLMEDASLAPRQRELLETAEEEVERLKTLVNDLLDLSKIEAGEMVLSFTAVSVPALIQQTVKKFETQAAEQGIGLEIAVPDRVEEIWGDFDKISWVLNNLLSNALRYTERGGRVTMKAFSDQQTVCLVVADTGIGVPPEYVSRIFDKFVQVDNNRPGGTGLGLAISKEIVQQHGGKIWMESEVGVGSVVTVVLPMRG